MQRQTTQRAAAPPRRANFWDALGIAWVAAAFLIFAVVYAGPASLARFLARGQIVATVFMGIFIEALPFLLLGTLASGAIQVVVRPEVVQRLNPRSPLVAALLGATMGICLLPVCECGTVPATRRLLAKGASPSLGIAFMLAAPVVNPVVLISTWIAFRGQPGIIAGRFALTILIAVIVGVLVGRRAEPAKVPPSATAHDAHAHGQGGRLGTILRHTGDEFFEMTRYLVAGALIAAIFQAIVPQEALLALGQGPLVSILALMALATVLSICSTVDAFVALAFAGSFLPGATLAFLVFGPMVDIKSVLLFDTTFQRRTVAAIVALTAALVVLTTTIINLIVV